MATHAENVRDDAARVGAQLGERLARIRLGRNLTQAQLARAAGTSRRTLVRLEAGEGVSLDAFVRVLMALQLEEGLLAALPDPSVRPIERVRLQGHERRRARGRAEVKPASQWAWDDDADEDGSDGA